jgi:alpha-tubulin suppressor-like RCC1 family protein
MYCWGRNSSGELGAGAMTTPITTPVRVDAPAVEFVAAAAGYYHTCGLTAGGGVKCWGVEHTLGTGSSSSAAVTQPVDVSGLASGISSLSASWNHTCAVENTGRLLCWGNGNSGVLGNGTNNAEYLPTQAADYNTGVAQADIGTSATCAVTTAGALQCWGSNQYYAVVDGSLYTPATPVIVTEY